MCEVSEAETESDMLAYAWFIGLTLGQGRASTSSEVVKAIKEADLNAVRRHIVSTIISCLT